MIGSRKGGLIMNEKPLDYSTLTKEQFDAENDLDYYPAYPLW